MTGIRWFDGLTVGHEERTAEVLIDEEVVRQAVVGYRHPLFTDPAYAATTSFGAVPLPGGVLLGLVGGMVEGCPFFEAAPVVLAGFDAVRFLQPVLAGDTLSARVRVTAMRMTAGGAPVVELSWTALNQRADAVMTARANFVVTEEGFPKRGARGAPPERPASPPRARCGSGATA